MSDVRTHAARVRIGAIAAGAGVAWLLIALLLVPWLIERAYNGEAVVFLDSIVQGAHLHPLETYMGAWWRVAQVVTVLLLGVCAMTLALAGRRGEAVRRAVSRVWFRRPVQPIREGVLFAAGIGAGLGLLEYVGAQIRYAVTGEFAYWSSPDMVWMAPLAGVVTCLVLVLPFVAAGRWTGRGISIAVLALVLVGMGAYGFIRSLRLGIEPAAVVVLAIGFGAAASRYVAGREALIRGIARRGSVAALALIAGLALAMQAAAAFRESRALGAVGASGARNVILIILDTVRVQSLGLYGHTIGTSPNLRRIAARGLVFEDAFAPSPWTLPSHASFFTGRLPREHRADWRTPLDRTYPTLAEYLAANGYATAGFVANLAFTTRESGLARGFIHYEDYPLTVTTVLNSSWWTRTVGSLWADPLTEPRWLFRKNAPEMNAAFLRWLDRLGDRPFFAFINYFDAHEPYREDPAYATRLRPIRGDSVPGPDGGWVPQTPRQRRDLLRYESGLAYLDEHIGRLVDSLDQRGRLDNTLLIITSDHGEQFGEHGLIDHGNSLYGAVLHVPLVIVSPDTDPGRVRGAVSLTDLPATVATDLGFAAEHPFPGWPLLTGAVTGTNGFLDARPRWVVSQHEQSESVVRNGFHYIRDEAGEELYRLDRDPWEAVNLTDSTRYADVLGTLRERPPRQLLAAGSKR